MLIGALAGVTHKQEACSQNAGIERKQMMLRSYFKNNLITDETEYAP